MSFGDYWEDKILNHIFGKAAYTAPAAIHVALSTADPTDDGGGMAEPLSNGYARVSTAPADWNASADGLLDNANDILFPEATGLWGTISHFALFNQAQGAALSITGVNQGTDTFTVSGNHVAELAAGTLLVVDGSTGNDGVYTVESSTFDTDHTDIVVVEEIPDATVDGDIHSMGNILAHGVLMLGGVPHPKEIEEGDTAEFAAGDLDVTLD